MTNDMLHKVDVKSRAIKKEPKRLFEGQPYEVTEKILGLLDFKTKKELRGVSYQTKSVVDREQFDEFKRYQKDDPEVLRSVVHFVDNGFSPPIIRSIIDVHRRLMQLVPGHPSVEGLCDQLIAEQAIFYKRAKGYFDWPSFKLLSTLTIIEMLLVTTNQSFNIINEKPDSLRLKLLTLHDHDKGRLGQCGGDIVKFISELSVVNQARYGQQPLEIFLTLKSTPSVISAFKAFFSSEKFHVNTSDYLEATFFFPEGEMR